MNTDPLSENSNRRTSGLPPLEQGGRMALWAVILTVWLFMQWNMAGKWPGVFTGQLADPDCYARLLRVQHLLDTRDWFDITIPALNAPYGGELHWTRPLDILLVAGMKFLGFWFPPREALYWAGVVISPVLHFLACLVLYWAMKPLTGERGRIFAVFSFTLQMGILGYASLGRADHHTLIVLAVILLMGLTFRMDWPEEPRKKAFLVGISGAFCMWISIEAQIALASIFAFFGVRWIRGTFSATRTGGIIGLGYLLGIALAIGIERPFSGYVAVENDKISIVHFCEAVLMVLLWKWLAFWEGCQIVGWRRRLAAFGVGIAAAGGVLFILFPHVLAIPMPEMSPKIQKFWATILENKSLLSASMTNAQTFFLLQGAAFLLLPAFGFMWWKSPPDENLREKWAFLFIGCICYMGMGMHMVRLAFLAEIFFAFIAGLVVEQWLTVVGYGSWRWMRAFLEVLGTGLFLFGQFLGFFLLTSIAGNQNQAFGLKNIVQALPKLTEDLNDPAVVGSSPATILCPSDFGPEIAYRTPHRVVGANYHRIEAGLLDVNTVLEGVDENAARTVLRRRDAAFLLLHATDTISLPEYCLAARLRRGEIPPWLRKILLVHEASGTFLLYSVDH